MEFLSASVSMQKPSYLGRCHFENCNSGRACKKLQPWPLWLQNCTYPPYYRSPAIIHDPSSFIFILFFFPPNCLYRIRYRVTSLAPTVIHLSSFWFSPPTVINPKSLVRARKTKRERKCPERKRGLIYSGGKIVNNRPLG